MPTAKPDSQEVYWTLQSRPDRDPDDALVYEDTLQAVEQAVGGGFLTQDAGLVLRDWFESHPEVTASAPGVGALRALRRMSEPGGWTPEAECDLLRYLTAHYLERDEHYAMQAIQDLYSEPHQLFGDLYADLFDTPPEPFDIAGKLVAFTGAFVGGSRRVCFDAARQLGATPSEVRPYTDCLFVADKHADGRVFSSKILMAVGARLRMGNPRIYREFVWKCVLCK